MSFAERLRRRRRRARRRLRGGRAAHARARASSPCASAGATCTACCAARRSSRGRRPARSTSGVGMVSTILLKDTSDRTAYRVFEPGATDALPGFGFANNLVLRPTRRAFASCRGRRAPAGCAPRPWFDDAHAGAHRHAPRAARRARRGSHGAATACSAASRSSSTSIASTTRCATASLDPARAAWPGEPPAMTMIHPGYNLLAEGWADMADEPLAHRPAHRRRASACRCARSRSSSARARSRRCSTPTDALTAADQMVSFRNGVRQALRRAGYHASFVCRPPFPNVMASGWHLHQSLVDRDERRQRVRRATRRRRAAARSMRTHTLSDVGAHWLAGLLAHGRAMAPFCAPTINAYARFRPNAMAPQSRLGPRQPRRDAARARPLRRRGDADREPHRRADGQSLSLHRGADPRRPRRHRAPPRRAAGDGAPYAGGASEAAADRASARRSMRSPPTAAGRGFARLSRRRCRLVRPRQALRARAPRPGRRHATPGRRASTSAASEARSAAVTTITVHLVEADGTRSHARSGQVGAEA